MPVPDRALTSVGSHLEVLGQLKTIGRTGVFAQPAEHAPRSVVGKRREHFAPRRVVAVPSDHDQISGQASAQRLQEMQSVS